MRIAGWPGAVLEVLESTDSTMEDALALARKGAPSGSAVMAGYQAKGRGRVPGRTWVSQPWESLLVTIVLWKKDVTFPLAELPLRAGVAAALAVEEAAGIAVKIKW
jgi:BirA family transcriptional regulator, biotin operon repressor / biotin---[acetyl-CoA-carboxylase] ligase